MQIDFQGSEAKPFRTYMAWMCNTDDGQLDTCFRNVQHDKETYGFFAERLKRWTPKSNSSPDAVFFVVSKSTYQTQKILIEQAYTKCCINTCPFLLILTDRSLNNYSLLDDKRYPIIELMVDVIDYNVIDEDPLSPTLPVRTYGAQFKFTLALEMIIYKLYKLLPPAEGLHI